MIVKLDVRSQFCYISSAAKEKAHPSVLAYLSYRVGKRDGATSNAFMADLRSRVLGAPQISTDGYRPYGEAVEAALAPEAAPPRFAPFAVVRSRSSDATLKPPSVNRSTSSSLSICSHA